MMMLSLQAMAQDFSYTYQGKILYYNITSGNTVEVVGVFTAYGGYFGVVIPSTVTYNGTTYRVTSIGGSAFRNCGLLTSVTIPNSVTSIGGSAFSGCSGLTSVTIPNSVTSIGDYVFSNCSGLTSINVASGNTHYSSIDGVLYNYVQDTLIQCPGAKTSVTIGNNVTSIGNSAFFGCSGLGSVTIPTGVTSIGEGAFGGCSGLTSVTIPNSVTSIGDTAFRGCSGLTSVILPNSLTSIGSSAFSGCSGLTSVTIPNSVTSIGVGAFSGCSGLVSVVIGDGITNIGSSLFENCPNLTYLTIGRSVESIGNGAFLNCTLLSQITSLATVPPEIGGIEAFPYPNFCTVTVPCGSLAAYTTPTCRWNIFFPQRITESLAFELSVSANDEAYGRVEVETQSCNVKTLTAIANDGYEFTGWNDGNMENPRTVTLTNDTAFVAIFTEAVSTPTITVTVNDATMGSATYTMDGNTAVLTATPNEGYVFTGWNDGNTENPRTVTVTSDTTFMAIFAEAVSTPTITVTVNDATMGSASYTLDGNTAVLTATPNEGYSFLTWSDGNMENPRTVTITSDTTFMAIFSPASSLQEVNAREFALYPNPAKSFVTLEFEALKENTLLQILDLNGRRVRTFDLKAGQETLRIDLCDLPKGVYTIMVGNTTKKLIVE